MDSRNLRLGHIIETEQERDAIHIAVAPVEASTTLSPGEHVGVIEGSAARTKNPIGVVDPFLTEPVRRGERFWLFLYPNTITSLRHEWAHPAFGGPEAPPEPSKISHGDHVEKSKAWIAEHARAMGLSDDVLMSNAVEWLAGNQQWSDYFVQHGSERWRDTFNATEFWHHYEVVTGTNVPEDKKRNPYCCTC